MSYQFLPEHIITATMDILHAYPEDALSDIAKRDLGRLRERLAYAAPECRKECFWISSLNYQGFYDICKVFNDNNPRSKAIAKLYSDTLRRFQEHGFKENKVATSWK